MAFAGRSKWIRVALPALLIVLWLVGAGVGGPYFGKVTEVASNDQTAYLPESAEATLVQQQLAEFRDSDAVPAVIVIAADDAEAQGASVLTDAQLAEITDAVANLSMIEGVSDDVSPFLPSEDGLAGQAFVPINDDSSSLREIVSTISAELNEAMPAGVTAYVTGPAGFAADIGAAFAGIDGLLLAVALIAVFIILVIVYRSLLLPIAVLSTSVFALTVALLTVWWLAYADILMLSGQTQGILFILVIGAATDYSLLYVARFREALRVTEDKWSATFTAIRGTIEPVLASGGTVIAGLLCLLLSDLKSNSSLGPVASIGIIFAMLAALTLLPAMLFLLGRAAFWPRRPRFEPEVVAAEGGVPSRGVWAWLGRLIRRKPRVIWLTTTALLLVGAAGLTQLNAVGVPQSDLVLGASESRDGQAVLGEHFAGGSGSPVDVIVSEAEMQLVADEMLAHPRIDSVSILASDSPSGTANITSDGIAGFGPPGTRAPEPTTVNGSVALQATLLDAQDSDEAQQTVRELRESLAETTALIGGVTATAIDTIDASIHDRNLIIPIVLVVILLILMLLLRAVLAPILLILTTVISFGTALGVAALMFNGPFGFSGADPAVPLFGFIFLVALGIDYNIFLMTRVREETLTHGTRDGTIRALSVTGGVITSAGLVLAATFAALSVIPVLFLVQIAFIVAFGVLIDTFLVRALVVPALVYDIGPRVWWPSKLMRETSATDAIPAATATRASASESRYRHGQ